MSRLLVVKGRNEENITYNNPPTPGYDHTVGEQGAPGLPDKCTGVGVGPGPGLVGPCHRNPDRGVVPTSLDGMEYPLPT